MNPIPNPVPAVLWFEPEAVEWHIAEPPLMTPEHDDVPALAVPDALWSDEVFQEACHERWETLTGPELFNGIFAAIHAELRARAV